MEAVVPLVYYTFWCVFLALVLITVLWSVMRSRFDDMRWRNSIVQQDNRIVQQHLQDRIRLLERKVISQRRRLQRLENFPFHLDRNLVQSMEKQLRQGVLHPAIYHDWCVEHGWDERARELTLWRGFSQREEHE